MTQKRRYKFNISFNFEKKYNITLNLLDISLGYG